jgi:hypothetical protein
MVAIVRKHSDFMTERGKTCCESPCVSSDTAGVNATELTGDWSDLEDSHAANLSSEGT